MTDELMPCPFCGDSPVVSTPEWRDDRRYIAMDVECCAKLVVSIGWGGAKDMPPAEVKKELDKRAAEVWNRRPYEESIEAEATAPLQAKIDELMLEYSPDEMTTRQKENWAAHQRPVSDAEEAEVREEAQEPVAWFAFADNNGPVPLELWGFDQKACKYAVLENARSVGWKGTVEGYLFQKSWTIKPLYTAPPPPAPCPYCDDTGDVHSPDGEWRGECNCGAEKYAQLQRENDALQAKVTELSDLSVTHIMLDVVPGADGMGEEIYAKSVADVERVLSAIGERNEGLTSKVAEQAAEIERLKKERDEYNLAWQRAGEEYRNLRDSLLSLAGEFK